jgi:hypothetical protein
MQKKKGFIGYDWFKLIVAILLGLAVFFLWQTNTCCEEMPMAEPMSEEVVPTAAMEESAEADMDNATSEEMEDTDANADIELPPFPEPSADLKYDAANGGLVDTDGNLVYLLSEDGSGWTPFIPADKADLTLEGEWTLLNDDGNIAYTWDTETRDWVAVPQEAEPVAEEPAATTNIVDCPGAAEARLAGGQPAEVVRDVNFRASPGVADNWIGGFTIGDQVSVMGETACTPYGNGAYLWWQVERVDGKTGWIAEAAANSPNYFLAPVE